MTSGVSWSGSTCGQAMEFVYPGQEPEDLPISHPIFHHVYDFKEKPQVPDIRTWRSGSMFEFRHGGPPGDKLPHFQAYYDDKGRMVALLCHNNDLGDGWEREGENADYFGLSPSLSRIRWESTSSLT